jgi:glycosyltransferase involved in cell wall biosynthesis
VDLSRLHFPGRVSYADYLRVLRRSDIHTYLSYPFIASWSLREALACGCTVLAADTAPVREFITDGVTGRLIRALDPAMLADVALALLEDPVRRLSLGAAARAWATIHLPRAQHLAAWGRLMDQSL